MLGPWGFKDNNHVADETLSGKQAAVSKNEKRTDMYISALKNFIKAMGGELAIAVTFPDGSVKISQSEFRIRDRQAGQVKLESEDTTSVRALRLMGISLILI